MLCSSHADRHTAAGKQSQNGAHAGNWIVNR
jgi:hypothetical protein